MLPHETRNKRTGRPPRAKSAAHHTPSTPRLPPELCDMVIDHLFDDKPSLAMCSLVSHSWLRAARYHLFDSICVHCEKDANAFENFLGYLRSTPSIRAYIKDVCFDGFHEGDPEAEELEDTLESTYLSAVTALLPAVHSYTFINCQWGRSADEASACGLVPLRSLHINSFVAASEDAKNKLRILRHFSHIEHLHLANMWLGHFGVDEHDGDGASCDDRPGAPAETRVRKMSLSMANICLNFLEYLRVQPFMKSLQSFRVVDLFHADYLEEHQDLTFVGELLRDRLSSTLEELNLELPRLAEGESAEIYSQLNLSSCQALRNVILRMPVRREIDAVDAETAREQADGTGTSAEPSGIPVPAPSKPGLFTLEEWRAPLAILSQLPTNTKSVSLNVELEGTNDAIYTHLREKVDWQQLDSILAKLPALESFSLRRVKEQLPYTAPWTKAQHDLIIRKLPSLRERQVLGCRWNSGVQ
ncbi:hypothetical protein PsYK624_025040 [Phanerochaete sordida]|uniref:F-box domain-containing protein n=1 Tax=Phanerochaete sordida TaxID=48140 RepID=A0A9P3L9E0_9APHY|nr:hypothetical protein PsYK624_025040 [Phanerochaete sordida]